MRITESGLRRIVRQEILRESAMPTDDLQRALTEAGFAVLGPLGETIGRFGRRAGEITIIMPPKPAGTLIHFHSNLMFMSLDQYLLVSQNDTTGMIMIMPATKQGEVDKAMLQQLGVPAEGFRSSQEMASWMISSLPGILVAIATGGG